jgi:hypothetical protein
MARRKKVFPVNLMALAFMCLALPLLGVLWTGGSVGAYLRFPPYSRPMNYPAFHPAAFLGFIVFVVLVGVLWFRGSRPAETPEVATATTWQRSFPLWGWGCLAAGTGMWVLAWTRFDWFAPFQPYTFIPQWVCTIGTINALIYARRGGCPVLSEPWFFLQLFPASAAFWWYFEYLNRFVNNWVYAGANYALHPAAYIIFATLAFATVIPGVYSTKELLSSFPSRHRISADTPLIRLPAARAFYILPLILTAAAFFLSAAARSCSTRFCGSAPSWYGCRCGA